MPFQCFAHGADAVSSKSAEEAAKHFSWLGSFVSVDNPVSSKWTQEQLGWRPKQPGLISDLDRPSYFKT
jgi:hypothetical protein